MNHSKVVELVFFYTSIIAVAYIMWLLFSPYFVAVALAGMLVITAYPIHDWLSDRIFKNSPNLVAFLSTVITFLFIVTPVCLILIILTRETLSLYEQMQNSSTFSFDGLFALLQNQINQYFPTVSISDLVRSVSQWGVVQLQAIFSSVVTFAFTIFISILTSFFFFRDGQKIVDWIVAVSPLPNDQDHVIIKRIHIAVRSVLTGIVLVSLLQGLVAGIGFWLFGVPKPVLWGTVAAFGGLLPGIGTPVIMIPAIIYLYFSGSVFAAGGLLIWALLSIVIVDNIIAPMLMSRGNALHPLLVLLSILGGISLFGMIGVIAGPVLVSIFIVLLQLQKKIIYEDFVIEKKKKRN